MALRFAILSLEEYLEMSNMPYELLPNGNILHRRGVFDSVKNLHTIAPVEIVPTDARGLRSIQNHMGLRRLGVVGAIIR